MNTYILILSCVNIETGKIYMNLRYYMINQVKFIITSYCDG